MARELLDVQRRVLGGEHPETLCTLGHFAMSLNPLGQYAEAEQRLRELLDVQRRVLGAEHQGTLSITGNVAVSLIRQGKYAEGERMLRELLAVQRRVLGAESPAALFTTSRIAGSLNGQGEYAEAEIMLRELIDVERRAEHRDTLFTSGRLAGTLTGKCLRKVYSGFRAHIAKSKGREGEQKHARGAWARGPAHPGRARALEPRCMWQPQWEQDGAQSRLGICG